MPGICGWVTDGAKQDRNLTELESLASHLNPRTPISPDLIICGKRAALAVSPANDRSGIVKTGSKIAAIHGTYQWSDRSLNARLSTGDPGGVLAEAIQKFGDTLAAHLSGAFSLAVINDESGELLLATDRFAIKQLAYFESKQTCVFASNTNTLRQHHLFEAEIDPDALFSYLFFHVVPLPLGIYRGVKRLSPGTTLKWTAAGSQLDEYQRIRFDNSFERRKSRELATEIKSHLQLSIDDLSQNIPTGAFLSGGVDSSTITAMLSEIRGEAHTYSIGFDEKGYDEMEYARVVAERFDTKHHQYYVTPQDVIDAVPAIAASYAEPFGNASAVPTYYCAKMAKDDGIQRLLGGDGGDELFGGNQRYAFHKKLSVFLSIPGPARKLLAAIFRDRENASWRPVQKISSYISKASIPLPTRLYVNNLFDTIGAGAILNPEYLERLDTELPQRLLQDRYDAIQTTGTLNKLLGLDWYFTLACNDLPKVTRMCELAGVDAAFPFLENSVVEFSSHLPDRTKVRGLQLRFFFKQAVSDILPEAVLRKTKHGFGLPFGIWINRTGPLRDFTFDNLQTLRTRGIVRPPFIDHLSQSLLPEHPQYYGVMAWILLMLEQFYQAHID